MGLLIITVTAIASAFGVYTLGQVFLRWHELGFAKEHTRIDERHLVPWVERFSRQISLLTLATFGTLVIGLFAGLYALHIAGLSLWIPAVAICAALTLRLCEAGFELLRLQFERQVGMPVHEACQQVAGGYR